MSKKVLVKSIDTQKVLVKSIDTQKVLVKSTNVVFTPGGQTQLQTTARDTGSSGPRGKALQERLGEVGGAIAGAGLSLTGKHDSFNEFVNSLMSNIATTRNLGGSLGRKLVPRWQQAYADMREANRQNRARRIAQGLPVERGIVGGTVGVLQRGGEKVTEGIRDRLAQRRHGRDFNRRAAEDPLGIAVREADENRRARLRDDETFLETINPYEIGREADEREWQEAMRGVDNLLHPTPTDGYITVGGRRLPRHIDPVDDTLERIAERNPEMLSTLGYLPNQRPSVKVQREGTVPLGVDTTPVSGDVLVQSARKLREQKARGIIDRAPVTPSANAEAKGATLNANKKIHANAGSTTAATPVNNMTVGQPANGVVVEENADRALESNANMKGLNSTPSHAEDGVNDGPIPPTGPPKMPEIPPTPPNTSTPLKKPDQSSLVPDPDFNINEAMGLGRIPDDREGVQSSIDRLPVIGIRKARTRRVLVV